MFYDVKHLESGQQRRAEWLDQPVGESGRTPRLWSS